MPLPPAFAKYDTCTGENSVRHQRYRAVLSDAAYSESDNTVQELRRRFEQDVCHNRDRVSLSKDEGGH
ncbi:hypothetical protein GJ744_004996 [Endocarpon pusillum]|uniref:Uncharacterized protein n=1 Tax=Endocarpon pusillum TaxID=364733 RepID=A0A8H7E1C0_9EURO|nr:hypothetical protein GJ744_004996 [Endocarpon pusillum]